MAKQKTDRDKVSAEMAAALDRSSPFSSEYRFGPTTSARIGSHEGILDRTELSQVQEAFSGVIARWGYWRGLRGPHLTAISRLRLFYANWIRRW